MPPNPSTTATTISLDSGESVVVNVPSDISVAQAHAFLSTNVLPPQWPGDPQPSEDWLTPQVANVFNSANKIPNRPMPSKDRCFYMVFNEHDLEVYMRQGHCFGVEEAAVLDAEPRVAKQQRTQYIFKCVGRLEFVKPKFEELESDNENTTGS